MNLFFQKVKSQIRYRVPISNIRTPFGEPFNNSNHWVRTLKEYDDGLTNYKESSLYKFHNNFCPDTIFDVTDLKSPDLGKIFPMGSYPWGKWTNRKGKSELYKSVHCGPSSNQLIEREWEDFTSLYRKIKNEGLNYKKYGNPLGLFFVDSNKEYFFIVLGGNHRTAIAHHLNEKSMPVRLLPRDYISDQVVKYSNINNCSLSDNLFKNILSNSFIDWGKQI